MACGAGTCVREVTARLRDVPGVDTVTADADRSIEDGGRGPKELTGMVDLTRDQHGQVHARLLDLVPGRSGQAYRTWLVERGEAFRAGVKIATLDPFHGCRPRAAPAPRAGPLPAAHRRQVAAR